MFLDQSQRLGAARSADPFHSLQLIFADHEVRCHIVISFHPRAVGYDRHKNCKLALLVGKEIGNASMVRYAWECQV